MEIRRGEGIWDRTGPEAPIKKFQDSCLRPRLDQARVLVLVLLLPKNGANQVLLLLASIFWSSLKRLGSSGRHQSQGSEAGKVLQTWGFLNRGPGDPFLPELQFCQMQGALLWDPPDKGTCPCLE